MRMLEMISHNDLNEWGLSIVTLYSTSLSIGTLCGLLRVVVLVDWRTDAHRFIVATQSIHRRFERERERERGEEEEEGEGEKVRSIWFGETCCLHPPTKKKPRRGGRESGRTMDGEEK